MLGKKAEKRAARELFCSRASYFCAGLYQDYTLFGRVGIHSLARARPFFWGEGVITCWNTERDPYIVIRGGNRVICLFLERVDSVIGIWTLLCEFSCSLRFVIGTELLMLNLKYLYPFYVIACFVYPKYSSFKKGGIRNSEREIRNYFLGHPILDAKAQTIESLFWINQLSESSEKWAKICAIGTRFRGDLEINSFPLSTFDKAFEVRNSLWFSNFDERTPFVSFFT